SATLGRSGGAGTIYLTDAAGAPGELRVINNGSSSTAGLTPVRAVGAHTIAAVEPLGANDWRVVVDADAGTHRHQTGTIATSGAGALRQHTFALTAPAKVDVAVTDTN